MLVIYNKSTNQIEAVWTGICNTLDTIYPNNPEIKYIYGEIMLSEDNADILLNKNNYRVDNGSVVLKPLVILSLSKSQISSDGIDSATLTVLVNSSTASIDIYFNGTPYNHVLTNNQDEIPITSVTAGTISITVDNLLYRHTPIALEVA
jgi:hypothetical protein